MKKISWHELKPQVKEVWVLSLPAILTQITTIVMQYIDSAMVGSLGANASAAIGLVSTSTWLLGGITYAVSAGFSVQVAHNIGAGRDAEARSVVRHGARRCAWQGFCARWGFPSTVCCRRGSAATRLFVTMPRNTSWCTR